jgi:hypothetical protein
MKFSLNIPFIDLNFINAKISHKDFFSSLFFPTNNSTKKLFSITVNIKNKITINNALIVEKDSLANSTQFVVLDTKNNKCVINFNKFSSKMINISMENNFDLYYLFSFILEPLIIIWSAHHNILYIHASGTAQNKKVTIYPAWRNTGKTNTILNLCQNNHDFSGDDFCIVYKKDAYLYPKSLNLFSYNLKAFPNVFKYLKIRTFYRLKVTMLIKTFIFNLSQIFSGSFSKVLFRISQLAEVSTNIKLNPDQLDISVCEKGKLDKVIVLQKKQLKKTKTEDIKDKDARTKILVTILYELKDFYEIYNKYKFLYPKNTNHIIETFEKNYAKLLDRTLVGIKIKYIPKGTQ